MGHRRCILGLDSPLQKHASGAQQRCGVSELASPEKNGRAHGCAHTQETLWVPTLHHLCTRPLSSLRQTCREHPSTTAYHASVAVQSEGLYDQPEIPEDWPRNKFVRKRKINWPGSLVMFIYICAFGFYCFVSPRTAMTRC